MPLLLKKLLATASAVGAPSPLSPLLKCSNARPQRTLGASLGSLISSDETQSVSLRPSSWRPLPSSFSHLYIMSESLSWRLAFDFHSRPNRHVLHTCWPTEYRKLNSVNHVQAASSSCSSDTKSLPALSPCDSLYRRDAVSDTTYHRLVIYLRTTACFCERFASHIEVGWSGF